MRVFLSLAPCARSRRKLRGTVHLSVNRVRRLKTRTIGYVTNGTSQNILTQVDSPWAVRQAPFTLKYESCLGYILNNKKKPSGVFLATRWLLIYSPLPAAGSGVEVATEKIAVAVADISAYCSPIVTSPNPRTTSTHVRPGFIMMGVLLP